MQLPGSVALCDAIEIAVLVLKKELSVDNILTELFAGSSRNETDRLQVIEALAVAEARSNACNKGYPFDVTVNMIRLKPHNPLFKPYLFMLLGFCLSHRGMLIDERLSHKFRSIFEDFVCWVLRRNGFVSEVLSIPRAPRGLPTSLYPALLKIQKKLGEGGLLLEEKLEPHDNDLDVDVIATPLRGDQGRGGWPVILIQCATSGVQELSNKMLEIGKTFVSVWDPGFYEISIIKGGATPEDLLPLTLNHWGRISENGWVLHRMRLTKMATDTSIRRCNWPSRVSEVTAELQAALPRYDWRNSLKF